MGVIDYILDLVTPLPRQMREMSERLKLVEKRQRLEAEAVGATHGQGSLLISQIASQEDHAIVRLVSRAAAGVWTARCLMPGGTAASPTLVDDDEITDNITVRILSGGPFIGAICHARYHGSTPDGDMPIYTGYGGVLYGFPAKLLDDADVNEAYAFEAIDLPDVYPTSLKPSTATTGKRAYDNIAFGYNTDVPQDKRIPYDSTTRVWVWLSPYPQGEGGRFHFVSYREPMAGPCGGS